VKSLRKCVYAVSVVAIFVAGGGLLSVSAGGWPRKASPTSLSVMTPEREEAAPAQAPAQVKIDNFAFSPSELKVAAGTTVEWVNRDDIPHTVVSDDKTTFKSKALDTDDKFSYTFTKPGIYPYFCSIHPKMTGKIIVQ
jgi:plastocyanin